MNLWHFVLCEREQKKQQRKLSGCCCVICGDFVKACIIPISEEKAMAAVVYTSEYTNRCARGDGDDTSNNNVAKPYRAGWPFRALLHWPGVAHQHRL